MAALLQTPLSKLSHHASTDGAQQAASISVPRTGAQTQVIYGCISGRRSRVIVKRCATTAGPNNSCQDDKTLHNTALNTKCSRTQLTYRCDYIFNNYRKHYTSIVRNVSTPFMIHNLLYVINCITSSSSGRF